MTGHVWVRDSDYEPGPDSPHTWDCALCGSESVTYQREPERALLMRGGNIPCPDTCEESIAILEVEGVHRS